MTEFMRKLREKVDAELAPVRRLAGDESQPVRTALRILQLAEEVEEELEEAVAGTARAAELTGWSVDTLQARAKAKLQDATFNDPWDALEVEKAADKSYLFRVASIPKKNASAA